MRAVVLRGGRLEVRETEDPVPGPGELLLRTLSTAIRASGVHFMDHHEMVTGDGTGRFVYDEDRDIVLGHEGSQVLLAMPRNDAVRLMAEHGSALMNTRLGEP